MAPIAVGDGVGVGVGVVDGDSTGVGDAVADAVADGDCVGAAGAVGAGGFGFIGVDNEGPVPPLQAEKSSVVVAMPMASMPARNTDRIMPLIRLKVDGKTWILQAPMSRRATLKCVGLE